MLPFSGIGDLVQGRRIVRILLGWHPAKDTAQAVSAAGLVQTPRMDLATEAPSVYFGSTMLPSRTRPHCVSRR
jgi:hypothetical protein